MGTMLHVTEQQTGEIGMHALIARNEFVRERKARHQPPLLKLEDRRKGAREEDTFRCGESYETFGECRLRVRDPSQSPIRLLFDARYGVDDIERYSR
jgi:hypothetical protein